MVEPTHIKPKELMFYFEEYLNFKETNKPFNFYKTYTKVKSVCNVIHSGYIAIFGKITIFGFAYSYYQKHGDNNSNTNNDKINGIDIRNIDKAKIKCRIGKKVTKGSGEFNNNNQTIDIKRILAISLISIYANHNLIKSTSKTDVNM